MFKRKAVIVLLIAMGTGVALVNRFYLPNVAADKSTAVAPVTDSTSIEKEPRVVYGMLVDDSHTVIEDKFKRNQVLGDLLEEYNVPAKLINQLSLISRKVFDPRKIAADKKYTLIVREDSVRKATALVYEPNPIDYIVFKFEDSLQIDVKKREVVTVEKTVAGVVQSNLSETIEKLGVSNDLTNKFVDIFGWVVDFQRLQKGDAFKLIYREQQVEGKAIGIEQIDAIYFRHFNRDFYAFPFEQDDRLDYYDEDGKSLKKALLKYPIEFTRISSRYTLNRFHPVQKRWKAHLGTDFAAPVGTPIRTVGDGVVLEAQYKSNNGNYVKIRHNGTYTTQYLHMSRIASGIRPGVHVRQGETIGFVGSTGLATGPHLCYRFWKNGVQVDALRADLPASEPISKQNKQSFEALKQTLMEKLQLIPMSADALASAK